VLLYHQGASFAHGGFLGVSVFFTLSGYLITSLLLAEHERTGRIDVRRFWSRRLRRLLPASLLGLALALVAVAVAVPTRQQASAIGDIRAALADVANWRFIVHGTPYVDLTTVMSPVLHFWSLAIEEQFYLVFPLLAALALRRGRATFALAVALVAVASLARQVTVASSDHVYFGTDTRAAELGVGALLALAWPAIASAPARWRVRVADVGGWCAFAALVVLVAGVDLTTGTLYRGGLGAFTALSVLLLVGAVEGASFARALAWQPLRALGRVSYGVYVVHVPLFLLLSADRTGVDGAPLFALRCAVTLAVAVASYHLLELPVRSGRAVRGRMAPVAVACGLVAVVACTFPLVPARHGSTLVVAAAHAPTSTTTTTAPTTTVDAAGSTTVPAAAAAAAPPAAAPPPSHPPRLVLFGDSTALATGAGLSDMAAHGNGLEVSLLGTLGCVVYHGDALVVRDNFEFTPACDTLFDDAVAEARRIDADAFVVFIGSMELSNVRVGDAVQHIGEPDFDATYTALLDRRLSELDAVGIPVLWTDVPPPSWDPAEYAAMQGQPLPGDGPPYMNDPVRASRLNDLDSGVLARHPLARHVPYTALLEGSSGTVPTSIRPDGLHLARAGADQLAPALLDLLATTYRAVAAADDLARSPVDWTP